MSDIKAGDLVMVVRPQPCCGDASAIGEVFVVRDVAGADADVHCCECGEDLNDSIALMGDEIGHVFSVLIRIDPPALPEDMQQPEELTA